MELPAIHAGACRRTIASASTPTTSPPVLKQQATILKSFFRAAASTTPWAAYIAQRLVKLLAGQGHGAKGARVGVLGLTFKENVADMRNSRVPDIVAELQEFGAEVLIHDPLANTDAASTLLGLAPFPLSAFQALDGLVLAVPHAAYKALPLEQITAMLRPDAVLIDVKSMLDPADLPPSIAYWSL